MSAVVLYRTDGIGDVILATACLARIYARDPAAVVYWIGRGPGLALIAGSFPAVVPVELGRGLFARIPAAGLIIDLQRNGKSLAICALLALRLRARLAVFDKGSVRRSAEVWRARLRGRRSACKSHLRTRRFEDMVACCDRALGLLPEAVVSTPTLPKSNAENPPCFDLAIGVGARHASKVIPTHLLSRLVADVSERVGRRIHVVLLGDAGDVAAGNALREQIAPVADCTNLTGAKTLAEVSPVLRASRATVSADSALGHLAEAVGCRTVMLFGPTVEAFGYAPHLPESAAFSSRLGCRPCSKDGAKPCRYGDRACFRDLPQAEMAAHLAALIKGGPPPS